MKIKVTKEIKELEGELIEKPVTFFGTSAHIPFPKHHTGKIVDVIVPTDARYIWLFSKEKLNEVISACKKVLAKEDSKMTSYKYQSLENLKGKYFSIDDLIQVAKILQKDKKNEPLLSNLKLAYSGL